MSCIICSNKINKVFKQRLLNKYDVQYNFCKNCGFLQTEKPYWLEEAYTKAIVSADTGLVFRNSLYSIKLSILLYTMFGKNGCYLDYGGGTGLFVRMMRDIGFDFYWEDLFSENVHAQGFGFLPALVPYNAVTAFEVLEHIEDPVDFIRKILFKTGAETIIFSTELFEGKPPKPDDWWYYIPDVGQHISFYQKKTLEKIAINFGFRFYSEGGLHMFTKIDFSELKFKAAVGKASKYIFPFISFFMKSKTQSDHEKLLKL